MEPHIWTYSFMISLLSERKPAVWGKEKCKGTYIKKGGFVKSHFKSCRYGHLCIFIFAEIQINVVFLISLVVSPPEATQENTRKPANTPVFECIGSYVKQGYLISQKSDTSYHKIDLWKILPVYIQYRVNLPIKPSKYLCIKTACICIYGLLCIFW